MVASAPESRSEGERIFLASLCELGVRYMMVGMSAALVQGARGSTEDVDLWFENLADPGIAEAAKRAGGFWVTRSDPPMLGGMGERFDVVTHLSGLPAFAANRPKDLAALPALETAARVIAELDAKSRSGR